MKPLQIFYLVVLYSFSCNSSKTIINHKGTKNAIVRISEIEVDSIYLKEYSTILKEEAAASMRLEPGVIAIYPMTQKEHPTIFRILEIYENDDAYQSHIKSQHFLKYKTGTIKMVKSLKLVDMNPLDSSTMKLIFEKLKNYRNK